MKLTEIENKEIERYLSYYDFRHYIEGKTFLITGGKGIVGSGIIKWLLKENEIHHVDTEIIASTREPNVIPDYLDAGDNIRFCKFGKEKEYCEGRKIDYIIHAASPTGNTFHKLKPVESLRVIIDETEKMIELANLNNNCTMIYLSSEEVYGLPDSEEPVNENVIGAIDSLTVRSCYSLGKKTAELLCYTNCIEYGTNVKIIRPTVIHGLLQKYSEERVVNEILRCIMEKKNLVMQSAGLTKKCLMYSLDAISAIFTVLFKGEKGEAYNATNPDTFFTIKDLANHLFEIFAPEIGIEFAAQDDSISRGYLPRRSLVQDISKIEALGWEIKTSLERIYQIDIERFSK